jgi:hypothetical protein
MHYHVFGQTAEIQDFSAVVDTVPTSSAQVSIDLQRSTLGGAYATVLSTPIVISASSTNRVAIAAAIASPDLVTGDMLRYVVTISGSGTQAVGLLVSSHIVEDPN